ncbi:MAG TPA: hypothetical protein VK550_29405 [Polyangiaceae bacterium]|nr:hypothetical protein [Polyangiaceae bacterium]
MAFDSGEYEGVVQTRRPDARPKSRVSCSAYGGPLSLSHSIGCGTRVAPAPKRSSMPLGHEVADVLSEEVRWLGNPRDHLALATIESEGYVHTFTVPASDFEAVGAAAHVARGRDHFAVVRA